MSSDLVRRAEMPIHNLDDLARLSRMFAESGYFTDARQAAQIGVKVLAGREMGFGPFASVNGVHIVEGKPTIGANLMAAAVKASGRYNYRVIRMDDQACELTFFEAGENVGVSAFTIEDAKRAGVKFTSSNNRPTSWAKFPRNMLFARALSNGVRWYCPDVFMGSVVYTPDELGADVDDEGNLVASPDNGRAPDEPVDAEFKPASRSDSLADKLKAQAEPVKNEPVDEFPPEPEPGFFGEQAQEQPEPGITAAQMKALQAALSNAGFTNTSGGKEQGRSFLGFLAGVQDLGSAKDLTRAQAARILDAIGSDTDEGYRTDKTKIEAELSRWDEAKAGAELEAAS